VQKVLSNILDFYSVFDTVGCHSSVQSVLAKKYIVIVIVSVTPSYSMVCCYSVWCRMISCGCQ